MFHGDGIHRTDADSWGDQEPATIVSAELDGWQRHESGYEQHGFEVAVNRGLAPVRVRVAGELDIATAPELDSALRALQLEGHHRLVLDLQFLEFIDAAGFAAIARGRRAAEQRLGGRLTIVHCVGQVMHFFGIIGRLDYLTH